MRHSSGLIRAIAFACFALLCLFGASSAKVLAQAPQQTTSPQPQAAKPKPPSGPTVPASPAVPAPPPTYTGPTIVLDPAHGGTDTGARGETGTVEKDLVLDYARMARSEFESEGFHVVLTRNDDSNPSYADRAALANSYRDAIFISLHVSSTGTFGTVHTYYYEFGTSPNGPSIAANTKMPGTAAHASSLVPWEDAQSAHVDASQRLANALQAQFAQRFSGSPATASPAAVRELRSVNAPAVAIEVASVSVQDPNSLAALAGPLAVAIARGLQAFRAAAAPAAASEAR